MAAKEDRDLPMMPWYPKDFYTATAHLARAERDAYRTLLDYQWMLGVLPPDTRKLARLVDMTDEEFSAVWPVVSEKFDKAEDGYRNDRLEFHRNKALELTRKRSLGARSTNAQRRGQRKKSGTLSDSLNERSAARSTAHPEPEPQIRKEQERNGTSGEFFPGEPKETPGPNSDSASAGDPPGLPTLDAALFQEARQVFGKSIGGMVNNAIKARGKPWVYQIIEACRGKDPEAARAYFAAAMQRNGSGHDKVVV
jgi:uncharacterized protein YdaU (DUF1376 family)